MNVEFVVLMVPIAVAAAIVILVAGRRDPDPDRRRTEARYLGAVCFLSVFVTLFGAYAVVAEVSTFIVDRNGNDSFSPSPLDDVPFGIEDSRPSDDAIWRATVQAALLTATAAAVLLFHRKRRRAFRRTPDFVESAGGRVDATYLYATCFLAAFVVLVTVALGTYGLFRAIAPGVTGFGDSDIERQKGIAQAISFVALAGGAVVVFFFHWWERPSQAQEPDEPAIPEPVAMT